MPLVSHGSMAASAYVTNDSVSRCADVAGSLEYRREKSSHPERINTGAVPASTCPISPRSAMTKKAAAARVKHTMYVEASRPVVSTSDVDASARLGKGSSVMK